MKPLLNIRTVSIEIEYKVSRAALRTTDNPPPRMDITRSRGQQDIRRTPGRLSIDTTEAKASMGLKTSERVSREFAQKGRSDARSAASSYADAGTRILESHGQGSPIADMAMERLSETRQHVLSFIPSVAPQIEYQPGTLSFDFTMDQLNFDWNLSRKAQMEYVPGNIEFSITQYPQVIIEYMGGPIYVPRSADPNYQPPPSLNATA